MSLAPTTTMIVCLAANVIDSLTLEDANDMVQYAHDPLENHIELVNQGLEGNERCDTECPAREFSCSLDYVNYLCDYSCPILS